MSIKEVLVIGSDHQNTLGIIRALGSKGIKVHTVIVGSKRKEVFCFSSRFCRGEKVLIQESEQDVLNYLLSWDGMKIPIIPTSDYAAMCIDMHYSILSNKFILPSIAKQEHQICKFMDKYKQIELASQYDIRMAKSIVEKLAKDDEAICNAVLCSVGYPCIMKPCISAEGSKSDIKCVENKTELAEAIIYYRSRHYREILIQELIDKKNELCCFGCVTENGRKAYYGTLKKLRYFPYEGGASLSYACFTPNIRIVNDVVHLLISIGYSGLFDFELFETNEGFLLNEINFRNSGNTWALVKNGLNTPYIWFCDAIGEETITENIPQIFEDEKYFMNETADIHHVYDRKIRMSSWIVDLLRTSAFNKLWIKDIPGTIPWYKEMILGKLSQIHRINR